MSKKIVRGAIVTAIVGLGVSQVASAGPNYQDGRVIDITMAGGEVMIRLDTGLPDNCAGAPYGWMSIPATGKPMQAYILGLQLRGDLGDVQMRVFTAGLVNGSCSVNQIDPT
ncbi:hypothetical protein [Steroidobacter agaridevorans]|uniref:hypothetical protein n=1 Tax=Steroidobacter agaridevorans TaxID=2695856 RepID=UPI001321EA9F|nr:hypothetical protein [Steroidobacter agaridevorans]GFE88655.1 hypothetical protein GCM10011488_36090 [Steroidobacter agaridevorans]